MRVNKKKFIVLKYENQWSNLKEGQKPLTVYRLVRSHYKGDGHKSINSRRSKPVREWPSTTK